MQTVDELLVQRPFYVAHRGSGDNWTEHTEYAYSQAVAAGAAAIEISVNATADGVLVCHHLTNTKELTGVDAPIAEQPYSAIYQLRNNAQRWLGPAAAPQPIPLLKNVLDRHAATHVIFIEDKQGTNTRSLLDLMDSYPESRNHFVWKQSATGAPPSEARQRGYRTWGYFTDGSGGQFERFSDGYDLLGIYHQASDDDVRRLVGFGKPVICWEVHYRSMRDRLLRLGVQGMMCSNYLYVTSDEARASRDAFATGLRAAGDLPWELNWDYQPAIQHESGSISLRYATRRSSYLMGSMCPIRQDSYTLQFEMRWPEMPASAALSGGLAFGLADDQPFHPMYASPIGGYFLSLNADGTLALFRQEANADAGLPLASVKCIPPAVGEWVKLKVDATARGIRFGTADGGAVSAQADGATVRGGYFSLVKNATGPESVEFRGVTVST
ncbi:glycerophosphodiester phosphodiesterase family protein [Arthrobacter sp. UYEF3]|uniref:glycerophosphodiester phosphodiesterase n=1 Tax=Arthrobacter sp. UYEF3 TaxID=1756365 RepID=UPI003396D67C